MKIRVENGWSVPLIEGAWVSWLMLSNLGFTIFHHINMTKPLLNAQCVINITPPNLKAYLPPIIHNLEPSFSPFVFPLQPSHTASGYGNQMQIDQEWKCCFRSVSNAKCHWSIFNVFISSSPSIKEPLRQLGAAINNPRRRFGDRSQISLAPWRFKPDAPARDRFISLETACESGEKEAERKK